MTVIKVKPHRNGWKVFEALGVEPVFLKKEQAINYAQNRASFRNGKGIDKRQTQQSVGILYVFRR